MNILDVPGLLRNIAREIRTSTIKGLIAVGAAWVIAIQLLQFGLSWNAVANPVQNVVVTFSDGKHYEGTLLRNWDRTLRLALTASSEVISLDPHAQNRWVSISFNGSDEQSPGSSWRLWACFVIAAVIGLLTPMVVFSIEKK
jgi:ribose/xylose/arabinose/galactoside ABC-type transport system permease subunit